MYSAVLMLALTAGGEVADHGRSRCHGCTVTTSCSASSCSSSCHARTGLFNRGCASSHACTTTKAVACSSSHGCSSACHGGGLLARLRDRRCHGCSASHCSAPVCSGAVIIEKKAMPKQPEGVPAPGKGDKKTSAPATIVINLPADARLIVDGTATSSVSDRRTLVTPALEVGATYVYTVQVEIIRDGRTIAQTQEVAVRGGETTNVQFQFYNQGVASR